MNYIKFFCFLVFMNGSVHCMMTEDPQQLERTVEKLTFSKDTDAECAKVAMNCWFVANDFLNNAFDNGNAIKFFNYFIKIYEALEKINRCTAAVIQHVVSAHTGIAMAFHNIGERARRDYYMAEAKRLLGIDTIENYQKEKFNSAACEYFVVDGYRHYIRFENSEKNKEAIEEQEKHLNDAIILFQKAITVSDELQLEGVAKSHAIHGFGTMLESLGRCKIKSGNQQEAINDFNNSITHFKQAVSIREKLLGPLNPSLARSFHKLARNYNLLGDISHQSDLIQKAAEYYAKALAIFAQSKVPQIQAKRAELDNEYQKFMAQHREAFKD